MASEPIRPVPNSRRAAHLQVLVAERLLMAGLKAHERADEAEAERRRTAFLFRASQQLAGSLEPSAIVRALADAVVPEFGGACLIYLLEADGRPGKPTTAGSDALRPWLMAWWDGLHPTSRPALQRAMKLAASEFGSSRWNQASSAAAGLAELSYLTVPIRAQGRTLGGLNVVSVAAQRRYDRADLIVAEALATQVGFALENARLYEAQRAMVARLEQARNELDAAEGARLREDERQRIARELHDRVEQTFFALALTAQLAMDEDRDASGVLSTALQRIGELATSGAEEMRAAIFSLNHASFAGRGLVEALWSMVRDFQQRTSIESDLVLTGVKRTVPADAAETLHAIAREALANVERHSRAKAVVLGLHLSRRFVTLTVHDDGLGASALVLKQIADSTTHFGLRGIRERVKRLSGTVRIGPAADGGFVVRARIPLPAELKA